MLSILDKYIIKKFLSTYFFMLGVIMLLSMVFDISARLSEFIANKAPIKAIIFDYYLNFIVYYGNTFSSMIVFISVIWFTAKLAQDTEIVPMIYSGKPFVRILKPYFISATLLMLLSIFINQFLLPISNKIRIDFENQYYRDRILVENYHAEFNGNQYVYFTNYNSDEGIIYDFNLELWNKENKLVRYVRAKTATNTEGTDKWILKNYYIRKVGETKDVLTQGIQKDTLLNFSIDEVAIRENQSETMTQSELSNFIKSEEKKGSSNVPKYKLTLYERSSLPFATYVLTLIGVAVSSRKTRGGIGLNIAIGLGFVFIYIFAMKVTNVAALNVGFPPLLAVWIPNIIFGFLGIYLYKLSPK